MESPDNNHPTFRLVDHLFRHEAGKMVAVLSRIFGLHHLDLIEDVVQESFLQALQTWKFHPLPDNPSGWLMQVAKRKALDILRRQKNWAKLNDTRSHPDPPFTEIDQLFLEHEIADSNLRLMFTCCHPAMKTEDQIAFTLKTVSGFGIREIAQALLISEDATKQRLHRARKWIIDEQVELAIPSGRDLEKRVQTVLTTLYLLFNEGYYTSKPDETIRQDLCLEAMRLLKLLLDHPAGNIPTAYALMALMLYHSARFSARMDAELNLILLADQDRSLWDHDLIRLGHVYMQKSLLPEQYTVYHLEAAIAAQHCIASSMPDTNWSRLLKLYQLLGEVKPSPLIALNRVVIHLQMQHYAEAKNELDHILPHSLGGRLYLFYAVEGEYHTMTQNISAARLSLKQAINHAHTHAEKKLLQAKLKALE